MDISHDNDGPLNREDKKVVELADELKLFTEIELNHFTNTLQDWVSKIQSCVRNAKNTTSTESEHHIKKLNDISMNFVHLLDTVEKTKHITSSLATDIFESILGSPTSRMLIETPRKILSDNIKLDFVHHDFEIGGLMYGLDHIHNHQYIITGHNSGYVNIWSKNTLQLVSQFKAHDSLVTNLVHLDAQNLLFTSSLEGKVKVFKSVNFPVYKHFKTLEHKRQKIFGILAIRDHNLLLLSCKEGYIHVYHLRTLKLIRTLKRIGPLDNNVLYLKYLKAICIGCEGSDTVELVSPRNFKTIQIIQMNTRVHVLKDLQYNEVRKEILVSMANRLIKIYKIENGRGVEDRDFYIDKPFTSKVDFIDREYMVYASLSDKLDFIKVQDGTPIKSINVGFSFADFMLLKDERRIIVFPYQSSQTSIAVIDY